MIPFNIILLIIITHWVADFVFQTDWMAKNKSKSIVPLSTHVFIYTLFYIPFSFYAFIHNSSSIFNGVYFLIGTYILHWLIDFCTSKVTSKLSAQGKYGSNSVPNFGMFSIIGLDQLLHYISLFGLYFLLISY